MIRGAMYARVSSDRQEQEKTIQSQLAELRARVHEDGVGNCQELIDEGYERDNLVRPSLDRLRDLVAQGDFDRLYIQCPDRLASGAKLVLLVEEFQQHEVQVVFLTGSVDETPEGKLLLHMQGAIAEYEHTKITERTRRGKLYWARQGAMVGGHAPYGYRFVRRTDTARARFEIDQYQASVVQRMYRWLVEKRMSTRGIARRLTELEIPTARGATQWQPTAVSRMLRNPVYQGKFIYCQFERVVPSRRLALDPYRKTGRKARPKEEWITIPVPAIVNPDTWEAAQEQLKENTLHSPRNNKRHQYLLRGLIRCPRCDSSYTGAVQHGYRRYRCTQTDAAVSSTGRKCPPGSISADLVEQAVWEAIKEALQRPQTLVEEYQRRLRKAETPDALEAERKQVVLALRRVKAQEDRVTDAYINEAMELDRYKEEMDKLRARGRELERTVQDIDRRERQGADSRAALNHLEQFSRRVSEGLDHLTFEGRQQFLRLVVERITVQEGLVRVETVIPTGDNDVKLRTRRPEVLEG